MATITSPNDRAPRPLRADAQRNYDLLLAAADAEFTEHGAVASLEDIARRARVGIGTLYRHFPTRDDLIAAVLCASTEAVVARGGALLTAPGPAKQLSTWIRGLVDHVTTYRGLTAALANSYVTEAGTRLCANCDAITAAGAALLSRAQAAGEIRSDANIREVILSAHAAAWIGEQTKDPGAVDRLLGILFDGLRASVPRATPRRALRRRPAAGKRRRR
jgi:AcrR family transcriptional regulator